MLQLLLDTNILIEFLKKNQQVKEYIIQKPSFISYINAGELIQGAKDKKELKEIQELVSLLPVHDGSPEISRLGLDITAKYSLSHNTGFADTLIAATAIETNTTLVTLNHKHFEPIKGLKTLNPLE